MVADPDPALHNFGKPDPAPHPSEKLDPDTHQSQNSKAVEARKWSKKSRVGLK
jgi:hypothetical protein